jgi:mono/diheme cytochrome c family protein
VDRQLRRASLWVALASAVWLSGCQQAPPDPLAHTAGAKVYRNNCLACHQAQGQGVAGVQPPLAQTPVPTGDVNTLLRWVMYGQRPAALPAGQYSGVMPQFSYLSDAELAAVLTYVRASFGNHASAVTSDAVKAVRQAQATPN